MIDTIRLACEINQTPKGISFTQERNGVIKGYINPTKIMKDTGKYYPRITYMERPNAPKELKIEFSISKLIKGNNFSEVCDADFEEILHTLAIRLREMELGYHFSTQIEKFRVVKVDYSKNIILEGRMTVSQVNHLIKLADVSKAIDTEAGKFRNGGQIYHLHTNGRDIAFYDKIADLKKARKSPKRAFEYDGFIQPSLFDALKAENNLSVLRFEVRLNSSREIKNNLRKIGESDDDLTFKRLFSSEISKKILRHWWKIIYDKIPKTPLDKETTWNTFLGLLNGDDKTTPQKLLATIGCKALIENQNYNSRFVEEVFDKKFSSGSWSRVRKNLMKLQKPRNLKQLIHIDKAIEQMEPIKIEDYLTDFW